MYLKNLVYYRRDSVARKRIFATIKSTFVSNLRRVGSFLLFPAPMSTDQHDITEILLKMALKTITNMSKYNINSIIKATC